MNDSEILKKKLAKFCAWRDRCTSEVKEKLWQLGAAENQGTQLIKWLTEEGYLDDRRFAEAFVKGKFNSNRWGKIKIQAELRNKGMEQDIISAAMESIDEETYLECAENLARKKWQERKENDTWIVKQKVAAYLSGKGFENEVIRKALEKTEKNPHT